MSIEIITAPEAMRRWSRRQRSDGSTIGFVPTMGALHDGHMALVRRAQEIADRVVVSVFVNPLQFDRTADLEAYVIDLDRDIDRCRDTGVDVVYTPTAHAMYPEGFETTVVPGRLGRGFEGAGRPGHFTGMLTVVTKLLATVEPDSAVFGEKDAQQLALVRRLVADLDLPTEIIAHPTVREADGLAMSSRNRRLDIDDRRAAAAISAALRTVIDSLDAGSSITEARRLGAAVIEAEPRLRIEYLEIVDRRTFDIAEEMSSDLTVIVAAWAGDVRLIDNMTVEYRPSVDR